MPAMFCTGPQRRREFLRAGALALGGMTLPRLAAASPSGKLDRNTSVIVFWMWGGPSQLETFDPKPDAPSEYRGPFRPIATAVPGMNICEIFPRLAQVADKYSIVRSVHHEMASHNDGSIEMLTGKTPLKADPTSTAYSDHPDIGMVVSRMRGAGPGGLPNYVGVPRKPFMTRPQYLGVEHTAFESGDPSVENFQPPNLKLSAGLNASRLDDRRALLQQFDRFRRQADRRTARDGLDQFHGQALDLLNSSEVAEAFNMERESAELRDRYGRTLWGQSCLLARRLAEAGVSLITIDATAPRHGLTRYFSWDDHVIPMYDWDLAPAMQFRAADMDPAIATLIEDLYARGLDRRVLLIAMGEFGRTPRISHAAGLQGRDHWPHSMSVLVSGGGSKTGQVIGATNSKAEYPVERPLTPQDLLATVYKHLGIDPQHEFLDFAGRPQRILHHGQPIPELL
ncbi:MAG: DUF1501 domain-containing protein [Planctomycetes bacterium]|nr:DUF1501 domain-containing protein [Planctomycetota bacterium]